MKNIAIIISALLLLVQTTWAQQEKPVLQEATKTALKEHRDSKVYPTKKAIHDQLMTALSEADRSLIESHRAEWKALNEEQRQVMGQLRKERKSGQTTTDRATALAPIREKRKVILEAIKPVLEANQASIRQAMEELKTHKNEWKVEREAILTQYESAETIEQLKQRREARKTKQDEQRKKSQKKGKAGHQKGAKAAKFLLWDGQWAAPVEPDEDR